MTTVLILATTTGYQTRAFGDAAARLGVDLVFATDRCHVLDDPWADGAIPIRFFDEPGSVAAIVDAARARPIAGVIAVGDRPTTIAAAAARALGLPGHPPEAAAAASHKRRTREQLRIAGLPVPWFLPTTVDADPRALLPSLSFPCIVKPVSLSGSRGVMRADDAPGFVAAFERLRALLRSPDLRAERNDAHDDALIEGFIPGREHALEGILTDGRLQVLALFDKPDPLDGPLFEETIYVTPSAASGVVQDAIAQSIAAAARALGLSHGPIHAECRVNDHGVYVLEVAARPIGGLCAAALRFTRTGSDACTLEELLLRHALGEPVAAWSREACAAGVMMIPIPAAGVFRGVDGADEARSVPSVEDVRITAKIDQRLVPLPEGASYLGFIFARGPSPEAVVAALKGAHARLRFTIEAALPIVSVH